MRLSLGKRPLPRQDGSRNRVQARPGSAAHFWGANLCVAEIDFRDAFGLRDACCAVSDYFLSSLVVYLEQSTMRAVAWRQQGSTGMATTVRKLGLCSLQPWGRLYLCRPATGAIHT